MEILYLETADEVLIRRYKETRRKHPMGTNTIMQGIAVERQRLGELRQYGAAYHRYLYHERKTAQRNAMGPIFRSS